MYEGELPDTSTAVIAVGTGVVAAGLQPLLLVVFVGLIAAVAALRYWDRRARARE